MASLGEIAQMIGACVLVFNAYQSWRNGRIARQAVAKIEIVEKKTDEIVKVVKNGHL